MLALVAFTVQYAFHSFQAFSFRSARVLHFLFCFNSLAGNTHIDQLRELIGFVFCSIVISLSISRCGQLTLTGCETL